MRIAVTGAAGFIGSHLCAALATAGHEVHGIDVLRGPPDPGSAAALEAARGMRLDIGDVRGPALAPVVAGCEAIVHLAGRAGARITDRRLLREANVETVRAVLHAARAHRVRRMVLVSSSSVYRPRIGALRETDPLVPVAPYGRSKLAGEQLGRRLAARLGVELVVVRPFTVYGPRQRPDMAFARYLQAARHGTTMPQFGDGRQRRDFTFVGDVVDGLQRALELGRPGATYNLASGRSVALADALAWLGDAARVPPPILLPVASAAPEPRSTLADLTRSATELGYRPCTSLADGLAQQACAIMDSRWPMPLHRVSTAGS